MCFKFHKIVFFLIISITCCYSQHQVQSTNVSGLTTTKFTTDLGKIIIYIPEHTANEYISGSIVIEPKGNSENRKAKNKAKLQQYQFTFYGHNIPMQSSNYSLVASTSNNSVLNFLDDKGNVVGTSTIPVVSDKSKNKMVFIPSYIVAGDPAKINIKNTGNLANNTVAINNTKVDMLAASETNVFFKVPLNPIGKVQLQYINDTTNLDEEVHVLELQLSADKLNLLKSESTTLNVTVSGLEGLDDEVPLSITNTSPQNIALEGGNQQQITIQPDGDVYELNQTIRATGGGGFSISVAILPPDDTEEQPVDAILCNCIIEDQSMLIAPDACQELGGQCQTTENPIPIDYGRVRVVERPDFIGPFSLKAKILMSYADDIEDLEGDIEEEWDKWERAEHIRDSLNALHGDLVRIDKVLDRVPEVYKDRLKKAVEDFEEASDMVPEDTSDADLNKAIADAEARLEACKNRIADLQKEAKTLEEQLEKDKEDLLNDLLELKNLLRYYNMKLNYEFHEDGTLEFDNDWSEASDYQRERFKDEGDLPDDLEKELRKKRDQYNAAVKRRNELPQVIEDAQDECAQLAEALQRAKDAKAKADHKAAKELELEEQCEQLKRILKRLKNWCKNNPDHCDFLEDIEDLSKTCPKTEDELEAYWKAFDNLVKKKKGLEDQLAKGATEADTDMKDAEDEISDLEDDIRGVEQAEADSRRKKAEAVAKKAAEAAAEQAEAKSRADAREKKRKKQKKDDDKIKDLIKKAKSSEAGDDAFKKLLTGMGLSLLDEATGAGKLGTLIGGILVVKDMPDCACKMFKLLKQAISSQLRGEDLFRDVFTNEYLREWNSCANLPVFSSIMLGSKELSDAIGGMSEAQCRKAISALDQAIRVQCK